MKTQPNPDLKNTAIFVGNDTELRKKAIEYYESEGYKKYGSHSIGDHITADNDSYIGLNDISDLKLITLPTEPKSEYPKMMLVWDNVYYREYQKLVICKHKDKYVAVNDDDSFDYWDNAKDLPTVTLTQSELIEAYEKSNNVKVIIK